jgi:putative ABC transport system permease protein
MIDVRETVSVAIQALRCNKLRTILTSLGVVIGSASIVLVVTVALATKVYVISQIEAVGSNLVWAEMVKTPDKTQPLNHRLTLSDMAAVKETIHGVVTVAGIAEMPATVVVEGRIRAVRLIGVTDGYQQIRRLVVLRGRYFDAGDMETHSKVCLITKKLADRVFGVDNPVGGSIRMGELAFSVIGVFRERAATYGLAELQEESVLIPLALLKYYSGQGDLDTLQAQAASPDEVDSLEQQMRRLLRSRHPPEADYQVYTLKAILNAAHTISLALTVMLIVVAFVALLISGVGIMNIMLVTVRERTLEIGLRKTLGATRKEILYQFLIEAFFISGGGAVVGILIGIAIPVTVQKLLPGNLPVPVSALSVGVAFVVASSIGLFFGYLPANQAARLQPIEALHWE